MSNSHNMKLELDRDRKSEKILSSIFRPITFVKGSKIDKEITNLILFL